MGYQKKQIRSSKQVAQTSTKITNIKLQNTKKRIIIKTDKWKDRQTDRQTCSTGKSIQERKRTNMTTA